MSELLELPPQNVTVVGAFNPAIFQPEWVRGHLPGVEGPIDLLLAGPPSTPPLLRFGETYLLVTSERLVVYGAPARVGRIAATILTTLPHTPLRAAGVNFLFQERLEPASFGPWRISGDDAGVRRLLRGVPQGLAFSHTVRREDDVLVTLKLAWPSTEPGVIVELNYHRDAAARPGEGRAKDLAEHLERAAEFEEDARRVREDIVHG